MKKRMILVIFLFIMGSGIKLQIEYEDYIRFQKQEYGLLKERKRLKYTPVLFYLFQLKVLKNKEIDTKSYNIPWEHIKHRNYIVSIYGQKYIVHCYYTDREKMNI